MSEIAYDRSILTVLKSAVWLEVVCIFFQINDGFTANILERFLEKKYQQWQVSLIINTWRVSFKTIKSFNMYCNGFVQY